MADTKILAPEEFDEARPDCLRQAIAAMQEPAVYEFIVILRNREGGHRAFICAKTDGAKEMIVDLAERIDQCESPPQGKDIH